MAKKKNDPLVLYVIKSPSDDFWLETAGPTIDGAFSELVDGHGEHIGLTKRDLIKAGYRVVKIEVREL